MSSWWVLAPRSCAQRWKLARGCGERPFASSPTGGFLPASRDNAIAALQSGAATIVFAGGDLRRFPAEQDANKIEVGGRKGYVRAALDAGVPTTSGSEHRRTRSVSVAQPRRV